MALTFTKMIIDRTEARRTREIISNADWNELFNLNITQGNHSENALAEIYSCNILNYDVTSVIDTSTNKVPTSKAVLDALSAHSLGDMLHEYYDSDWTIKNAGGIALWAASLYGAVNKVCGVSVDNLTNKNVLLKAEHIPYDDDEDTVKEKIDSKIDNPLDKSNGQVLTYDEDDDEWKSTDPISYSTHIFKTGASSEFTLESPATLTDYPYRASITDADVTADDKVYVEFNATQINAGIYAPMTSSYAGGFYIYADSSHSAETIAYTILKA